MKNTHAVYGIVARHACLMVVCSGVRKLLDVTSYLLWKLGRVYRYAILVHECHLNMAVN